MFRAAVPVTVDGDVAGDHAWAGAPASTGFSVLGDGFATAKQTTARILWDDAALYVGVVCEEPDAALLKPAVRDYGDTWVEDSLEIFVQPVGQVYQLGVTAGGAKGAGEGGPDLARVTAAARIGKDSYSIEVRIPFEVLKSTPKAGGKWHAEVCRNIFTTASGGDKFTSWTPLQSRFLEPDNFATLAFSGETRDAAGAATITEQLNAPYRAKLTAQVKAAAVQGQGYLDTLKQAAADAKYGESARALLADWQTIEKLGRQADTAGILDIRTALMKLQALNEQSYQVKYKYLIEKLLTEN